MRQESNFSLKFRNYLKHNPFKINCWFEIKDTRGKKSFPLKEWKQAQRDFAESLRYSTKGILVRTEGVEGLPDYHYSYQEPTFVVINFPEGFTIISADTLMYYKGKSITFDQAKEIAIKEKTY
jgi:hypothetical protein